ncbi:MAG TPA: hypothetical protein VJC37_07175, partial [Planctomycetota bacterium]|nr:hypothetical protein [Planctomycetota bacterium]
MKTCAYCVIAVLLLALLVTSFSYVNCGGGGGGSSSGSSATSGFAATTNPAISITADSAILTGLVNPYGLTATAYFQWGLTTSYGTTTTAQTVISGTGNVAISATLSGL